MPTSTIKAAGGQSNVRKFASIAELESAIFELPSTSRGQCIRATHRSRDSASDQARNALDDPHSSVTVGTIRTVTLQENNIAYVFERNDGSLCILQPLKGSGPRNTLKYLAWTVAGSFTREPYVWGLKPNTVVEGIKKESGTDQKPVSRAKDGAKRKQGDNQTADEALTSPSSKRTKATEKPTLRSSPLSNRATQKNPPSLRLQAITNAASKRGRLAKGSPKAISTTPTRQAARSASPLSQSQISETGFRAVNTTVNTAVRPEAISRRRIASSAPPNLAAVAPTKATKTKTRKSRRSAGVPPSVSGTANSNQHVRQDNGLKPRLRDDEEYMPRPGAFRRDWTLDPQPVYDLVSIEVRPGKRCSGRDFAGRPIWEEQEGSKYVYRDERGEKMFQVFGGRERRRGSKVVKGMEKEIIGGGKQNQPGRVS